jgi:ribose transport system ATP-binding protein
MASHLLEVRSLSKRFPGVQALDKVALHIDAREVLAVVGENGAGKSTLMKILAGIYAPDAGEVLLDNQPLRLTGVRDALSRGIVLIHQELNLAGSLSVAANLFLGRERLRGGVFLDRRTMAREGNRLLARVGLNVPLHRPVADLSLGQQQLVEIARALDRKARILIMDEPTSSLTTAETERLFTVIAELKRSGVAVVYISHRLAEVREVADRVTVLRDGRNAGELARDAISHDAIVRLMVGREITELHARKHVASSDGTKRLELHDVRFANGTPTPISLHVRAGEIVGLAGLVGAGRTELAEAIFGLRPVESGIVVIDGETVAIRRPCDAIRRGLLLVPEDRRLFGLIQSDSVQRNLTLPSLDRLNVVRLIARRRETALATNSIAALRIKTPSRRQPTGLLSGGNQQKVVFGKWLARGPKVLLLDEPTRGVDVGARGEIYALMDRLAGEGVAILMISSDLEELLGLCNRILVMHQGDMVGELARSDFSEEAVMRLATGCYAARRRPEGDG